jgi:aryl-alcohol dehydrogenase-like predicted oxidoreductase
MKYRRLGKTNFEVSEISLGTWQVGGKWGKEFNHKNAEKTLNTAIDNGINFIDTADVYSEGESEKAVGRLIRSRSERIYVASKCGRQLNPHTSEQYTPQAIRKFVEASLSRMQLECLDLIQLHCPPTTVYSRPEIFGVFDQLIAEGKILKLGVSVEKIEEAIKAIEYPNVDTVQIIFNIFRQRPSEEFFRVAQKKDIGILARVPLASGLLSGKYDASTQFLEGDHRFFNRDGFAFDKGETFSGIDYHRGLASVDKLKKHIPQIEMHLLALKWILMFEEVSCVIPGASHFKQVLSNIKASAISELTTEQLEFISELYNEDIKTEVHHLW